MSSVVQLDIFIAAKIEACGYSNSILIALIKCEWSLLVAKCLSVLARGTNISLIVQVYMISM